MRYFVTVDGHTFVVELSGEVVEVDGRAMNAELRIAEGTPVRHLLLDGRSYPLVATENRDRGGWDVDLAGQRLEVEVLDERTRAIREMTGRTATARGLKPVRAPMPGLIVRVEVEAGQAVEPGQGVAVIEAMKMENELRADGAGVVARVLVRAGQAVERGAVLIEFEEADIAAADTAPAAEGS